MILADCPRCGRRELRGSRSVHLYGTDHGNVLAVTCRSCGAELVAGTSELLSPAPLHAVA